MSRALDVVHVILYTVIMNEMQEAGENEPQAGDEVRELLDHDPDYLAWLASIDRNAYMNEKRRKVKIIAYYDPPPIPDRSCDWRAIDDDSDGTRSGFGPTREDAIADLVERMELESGEYVVIL